MKPIIQEEEKDTILTKDVTDSHIVVAIIDGNPRILSRQYNSPVNTAIYLNVSNGLTKGNGRCACKDTLKDTLEYFLIQKQPIAVFHQSDWKQALQWLIDNALNN